MLNLMQYTEGFVQQANLHEYLDVSKRTVERWIQRGELPPPAGNKTPKLWRKNDLELWGEWGRCSQAEFVERKKLLTAR